MQKLTAMTLLVSLHDVTPLHAARLVRAERLLTALGLPAATYLLVPDFHRRAPIEIDDEFIAWCRAARPYAVEWFLHGYAHKEDEAAPSPVDDTLTARFARRLLTNGEGEFLSLRGDELTRRLHHGSLAFGQVVGGSPAGFVAPAWLYNDELLPALNRLGVRFTESHFHLFDIPAGRATRSPVITWATRSRVHRAGSRLHAAASRHLWRDRPVLRVALHPADFDHPPIVDSIARTLDLLRRDREVTTCTELHSQP